MRCLTDAVRKGMKAGNAPADVSKWAYGKWHVVDIEHPLSSFLPYFGRIAGTGAQPLSGDTTTVKQVGRTFGPSQRFTMDWSNVDGSTENIVPGRERKSIQSLLPRSVERLLRRHDLLVAFQPRSGGCANAAHVATVAMTPLLEKPFRKVCRARGDHPRGAACEFAADAVGKLLRPRL